MDLRKYLKLLLLRATLLRTEGKLEIWRHASSTFAMSQLTQQMSFHLLIMPFPTAFPNAIFQNKHKHRVMETHPVAGRHKWSTTGIHCAIVFPCSHKPPFTCEHSIKFLLVCGSMPSLHHLFISPNLVDDTGYRYRPQPPGLSQSRLVTDTQPRMARPVSMTASPALLIIAVGF